MKKDIKQKKEKRQRPTFDAPPTTWSSFLMKNLWTVLQISVASVVVIFAAVVWRSTTAGIKNLVNAERDVLVATLQSEIPHVFYCHRGGKNEVIPSYFSEINMIKGSKVGFATVNCSQTLPSGKTIWDKFNLKKEWRPVIFGTAPWLLRPKQAMPKYLKDLKSFTEFVDVSMAPRATEIKTDKELASFCGYSKNFTFEPLSITPTCFILLKGARHAKLHTELEERIVRKYPKTKFALIDATKRRMSFETAGDLIPADQVNLLAYALRNGTHFMPLRNPMTWDYLSTFVAESQAVVLEDFHEEPSPYKLLKASNSAFKDRSAPKVPPTSNTDSSSTSKKGKKSKSSSSKAKSASNEKGAPPSTVGGSGSPGTSEGKVGGADPVEQPKKELTEAEKQAKEAERLAKERARREEMERLARDYMVEEDDGSDSEDGSEDDDDEEGDEEGGEDEDDKEVIEL